MTPVDKLDGTYVFYALRKPRVYVPQDLGDCSLSSCVVAVVEGGRVDEGEREGMQRVIVADGQVDIDGDGANVRGEAAAALDELCDVLELFVCGRGGNERGVEEETEEGGLACAPACDHERVAGHGLCVVGGRWTEPLEGVLVVEVAVVGVGVAAGDELNVVHGGWKASRVARRGHGYWPDTGIPDTGIPDKALQASA